MSKKSAGQQVSRSAGQQVSRSAGQQVSRSAGQQVSRSAGQQVSRSAGQQVSRSAGQQVSRSAGQQVSRSAGQQVSRSAGQQVSRSAGQQVSRSAGQQVSRSAGQQVSTRILSHGKQNFKNRPLFINDNLHVLRGLNSATRFRKVFACATTFSLTALLFVPAAPVLAQGGTLEEIIVTAQKREESIQDVAIAITAFSGEQLDALRINASTSIAALTPWRSHLRQQCRLHPAVHHSRRHSE